MLPFLRGYPIVSDNPNHGEYAIDPHMSYETASERTGRMPEPRAVDLPLLPTGRTEREYLSRFMDEFGKSHRETAILEAATGHRLAVSRRLFEDHKNGRSKIEKRGRAPYLLYLAETIKEPDEIWLVEGSYGPLLYLLVRYRIHENTVGALAVFKEQRGVWEGWSAYQTPRRQYLEKKRNGILIYTRPEKMSDAGPSTTTLD